MVKLEKRLCAKLAFLVSRSTSGSSTWSCSRSQSNRRWSQRREWATRPRSSSPPMLRSLACSQIMFLNRSFWSKRSHANEKFDHRRHNPYKSVWLTQCDSACVIQSSNFEISSRVLFRYAIIKLLTELFWETNPVAHSQLGYPSDLWWLFYRIQ